MCAFLSLCWLKSWFYATGHSNKEVLILFKSEVSAPRLVFVTFSFLFLFPALACSHTYTYATPLHTHTHISIHIATTKSGLIEKHLLRMLRSALLAWGEDKGCYIIQGTWPFKWYPWVGFYSASISLCFDLSLSCVFSCLICLCQANAFWFLDFHWFFVFFNQYLLVVTWPVVTHGSLCWSTCFKLPVELS